MSILPGQWCAEHRLDLVSTNAPRSEQTRLHTGEIHDGGLDADIARAAIEHQRGVCAEVIQDMLPAGRTHPAKPVRLRRGHTAHGTEPDLKHIGPTRRIN